MVFKDSVDELIDILLQHKIMRYYLPELESLKARIRPFVLHLWNQNITNTQFHFRHLFNHEYIYKMLIVPIINTLCLYFALTRELLFIINMYPKRKKHLQLEVQVEVQVELSNEK